MKSDRIYYDKSIFAKNLNHWIRASNETKSDISRLLGVSKSTVSAYCKGQQMPRMDKIEMLAAHFGIQKSGLLEDPAAVRPHEVTASSPILPVYNALNPAGKTELVRYGRYLGSQPEYQAEDGDTEVEYIRHYLVPAAAGYASPIEGEDYDLIPKDSKTPYNADFCIDIDGDSMEPYIHDGQRVYVQRGASLTDFDVGVFFVDGDVYCKQYCIDMQGTLYLLSANPAREDANITIRADSGRTAVCFGKVLLPHKLPAPVY